MTGFAVFFIIYKNMIDPVVELNISYFVLLVGLFSSIRQP